MGSNSIELLAFIYIRALFNLELLLTGALKVVC